jgi:hypothetical protein
MALLWVTTLPYILDLLRPATSSAKLFSASDILRSLPRFIDVRKTLVSFGELTMGSADPSEEVEADVHHRQVFLRILFVPLQRCCSI